MDIIFCYCRKFQVKIKFWINSSSFLASTPCLLVACQCLYSPLILTEYTILNHSQHKASCLIHHLIKLSLSSSNFLSICLSLLNFWSNSFHLTPPFSATYASPLSPVFSHPPQCPHLSTIPMYHTSILLSAIPVLHINLFLNSYSILCRAISALCYSFTLSLLL